MDLEVIDKSILFKTMVLGESAGRRERRTLSQSPQHCERPASGGGAGRGAENKLPEGNRKSLTSWMTTPATLVRAVSYQCTDGRIQE